MGAQTPSGFPPGNFRKLKVLDGTLWFPFWFPEAHVQRPTHTAALERVASSRPRSRPPALSHVRTTPTLPAAAAAWIFLRIINKYTPGISWRVETRERRWSSRAFFFAKPPQLPILRCCAHVRALKPSGAWEIGTPKKPRPNEETEMPPPAAKHFQVGNLPARRAPGRR